MNSDRIWLASLRPGFAASNLDEDLVQLVLEIVDMASLPESRDQRALFVLVLSLLAVTRRGSTRLCFRSDVQRGGSAELSSDLQMLWRDLEAAASTEAKIEAFDDYDHVAIRLDDGTFDRVIGSARDGIGAKDLAAKPLVCEGDYLYRQSDQQLEVSLASLMVERLAADDLMVSTPAANAQALPSVEMALSDTQQTAIEAALRRPLFAISGGPGTGKTTLVAALLHRAQEVGIEANEIALAAPTGKAAYRLEESIGKLVAKAADAPPSFKAKTLHRLLGYDPRQDRFRHHRQHPIEAKLVIVDEASMIDLRIMERLLDALRPDSRLILLGDTAQLPAVESGRVFEELVSHCERRAESDNSQGSPAVARLEENFRQDASDSSGRDLIRLAGLVREGDCEGLKANLLGLKPLPPAMLQWQGIEWLALAAKGKREAAHWRDAWFDEALGWSGESQIWRSLNAFQPHELDEISVREGLRRHASCRVLSTTRVARLGTLRINASLREGWARRMTQGHATPERFLAGEPIMVIRNDPQKGLFNGDQGMVVAMSKGRDHHVVFERLEGLVYFPLNTLLGRIESSFATTVHKSQGSEFETVLFVLPDYDHDQGEGKGDARLERSLLYTALTRAKRCLLIDGSWEVLVQGASRDSKRSSGLGERLLT